MELVYFLSVKEDAEVKDLDIALVEGVVSTERDKKDLEKSERTVGLLLPWVVALFQLSPAAKETIFLPGRKKISRKT